MKEKVEEAIAAKRKTDGELKGLLESLINATETASVDARVMNDRVQKLEQGKQKGHR